MNKRIFRLMSLLVIINALIFSFLLGIIFLRQFENQIKDGLKTLRISIMDTDGEVVFDNFSDVDELENHAERPEVIDAQKNDFGESKRYSDTLKETTYYYALRLSDNRILRFAFTSDSFYVIVYHFLQVIIICLLISLIFAFILAKKLTKRIIAPINEINLDSPSSKIYDELFPFIKKIETQKEEIAGQFLELEKRTDAIKIITENMKEGLLLLDEKGKVILANKIISEILEEKDITGRELIHICRDLEFTESINTCLAGSKSETLLKRNKYIYNVICSPVFYEQQSFGAIIFFIDITQQYDAEMQRKEFSANVSHELKTPLTTIAALSEMITNGTALENDTKPFAQKIFAQSKRLINIIEDIIRLSEFDEKTVAESFDYFNLSEVAKTVVNDLEEKAKAKNVFIEIVGKNEIFVTANRRMIDELIFNLVDNAIKYNVDNGKVIVHLKKTKSSYEISVSDTGIGISKEHLNHIFERFYRVDKSRSKKTGGTGLGLSIVKHVVEYHKGKIEIESKENEGTKIICIM